MKTSSGNNKIKSSVVAKYLRMTKQRLGHQTRGDGLHALIVEPLEDRTMLSGFFGFADGFGGVGTDAGTTVSIDSAGNVLTAGFFQDTVDFDPGAGVFNLTSAGGFDSFVSKVDSDGNFLWARSFAGASVVVVNGIIVDSDNNVITTGFFSGTIDFDPGPGSFNLTSAGSDDVFVSKLDSNGDFVWAKAFSGVMNLNGMAVAVDSNDSIVTTGRFTGTVDFDPGPAAFNLTSAGFGDVFVSKLNDNGEFVWARAFSGTNFNFGSGIAVDSEDNVVTTGSFSDTTDFDPGPGIFNLTSNGLNDVFVSKLDGNGDFVWAKGFGGVSADEGGDIAVDSEDDIVTAGRFNSTADFDPGPGTFNLTSNGFFDVFVSKLESNGNFFWARGWGGGENDAGSGIAVDSNDGIVIAGHFSGQADFDPGIGVVILNSVALSDMYVSRLDSLGDFSWARSLGGSGTDFGLAIVVDAADDVITTGVFAGIVDFNPGPRTANLSSFGDLDVFVSKLTQSLNFQTQNINSDDNLILRRSGNLLRLIDETGSKLLEEGFVSGTRGVVINGAAGEIDRLTVDFASGGHFSFQNGIVFNGNTGSDSLKIIGTGATSGVYTPSATITGNGEVRVTGSPESVITFSSVDQAVEVIRMSSFTLQTPLGSVDTLTATARTMDGDNAMQFGGTVDGIAIRQLRAQDITHFTVDTGRGDDNSDGDTVTFQANSFDARGLKDLTVMTGKGDDRMRVVNPDLTLPVFGGLFRFIGQGGTDTIDVSADVARLTLTDEHVRSSGGGTIMFDDVEAAFLAGGASANVLHAANFSGNAVLNGLDGDDRLVGGTGDDMVNGGAGNDILLGRDGNDTLNGDSGNDILRGDDGNDILRGSSGDDRIWGGDGDDILHGFEGTDRLFGESGDDIVQGGDGNDYLYGGIGNDRLLGGTGIDLLFGEQGNDFLRGDAGRDFYAIDGTSASDRIKVIRNSPTNLVAVRTVPGLTTRLEQDWIVNDNHDELAIYGLDGDDLFDIDLAITIVGAVDGGNGSDSCIAPNHWLKTSC